MARSRGERSGTAKFSISMSEELARQVREYIVETAPERPDVEVLSFSAAIDELVRKGLEAHRAEHGKRKEKK